MNWCHAHLSRRLVFTLAFLLLWISIGPVGCDSKPADLSQAQQLHFDLVLGSIGDTPGRFTYPRALRVDPVAKTLWIIDRSGRVQQLDPQTGRCLSIFKMPTIERGFPVGFTIAPGFNSRGLWTNRLLYIADTHNYRVMIIEPPIVPPPEQRKPNDPPVVVEPTIVKTFGSYGTDPGQFIYPTDIAVLTNADQSKIERIYVGEYGSNDRVSVFDADFNFLFSFGSFGSSDSPDSIQFNRPQILLISGSPADPIDSRELIIADARNHRIGFFTLDGKLKRWIGSADLSKPSADQFQYPWGMVLLDDHTALLTELQLGQLRKIDLSTGKTLGIWCTNGSNDSQLYNPWSLQLLDQRVYIADGRNNRLVSFPLSKLK